MIFMLFLITYPASNYTKLYNSEQSDPHEFLDTYYYEPKPSPEPLIDIKTVYDNLEKYSTSSPSPVSTLPFYYETYSYYPHESKWELKNDCGTFHGFYTNTNYRIINDTVFFDTEFSNTTFLDSECRILGEMVEKERQEAIFGEMIGKENQEVRCNTTLMTLKGLKDIKYRCKYVSDTCIFDKRCIF